MPQARILIADDSCTVRTVVSRILTAANFDVILARDGAEAVELARRERPHLVILDIQMPEKDGYAACEEILALDNQSEALPIVFLTKDRASHLDSLGIELGAYLQKPICEVTLLSTIRRLLKHLSLPQPC